MDHQAYRDAYFVDPEPEASFAFAGTFGITLFIEAFAAAAAYYEQVFGPPAYVEGARILGWRIGAGWLTLLEGTNGSSQLVEVQLKMSSPGEAERLQAAFLEAGGSGPAPSDQLMYEPIRSCPVRDPFGIDWLVYCRLPSVD